MLNKYVVKDPKTAFRIIDGEAVVVTPQDSLFHTLNEVATKIWEWIDGKSKVREIIEKVYQEFEVDRDTAEKDCLEFINEAVNKGMLILLDEPAEV